MNKTILIGTRSSALALYQSNLVKDLLESSNSEIKVELVEMSTKGDRVLDVPLAKIGDKGLFTLELDNALREGKIDMAVHSLKDLPTVFVEGTKLGAVVKRADYRDAFLSVDGRSLQELTENDTVATSSLRRKAQVLNINPKVKIIDIRGNVGTRVKKMKNGHCDAMLMASAGLTRLDMQDEITSYFPPNELLPAPAQGAIAVQIRAEDSEIAKLVKNINHKPTEICITAERAFLNQLEGGCQLPIGALAKIENDEIILDGLIASTDGKQIVRDILKGSDAETVGRKLANSLLENGGNQILTTCKIEG